ncbi:hypothetical protein MASR1M42_24700 [Azonexus hydrophilus]
MAKQKSIGVLREEREQLAAKIKQLDAAIRVAEQREIAVKAKTLLDALAKKNKSIEDVLLLLKNTPEPPRAVSIDD